jgi:hypothetical protein
LGVWLFTGPQSSVGTVLEGTSERDINVATQSASI